MVCWCVFYYCRTYYKAVREGGEESGGHVLRETMSRGLCGLVCPSRTSERGLGLDVDNPASGWDVQIVLRVHVR